MPRTIAHDVFNMPVREKKINSKAKGNTNEREAAKTMSLWVGKKFVRVPSSGAIHHWDDNEKVTGDIICDERNYTFPFTLECKHLKSIPIKEVLQINSKIFTIWEQAVTDAKRAGKLPMALLRCNGMMGFKQGDIRYQDYYCVMDTRFGGSLIQLQLPFIFTGQCDRRGYKLIGFMLSDLIAHIPAAKYLTLVEKLNLRNKFISFVG